MSQTAARRGPVQVVVATTVFLSFISFWRAAAIVLADLGSSAFYAGGIAEQAVGKAAPVVHPRRHAVLVRRPGDLHRKLDHVRAGRRLPRRQGGDGRHARQAVGLGAAVRLRPHRPDQRHLGRPVHRRAAQRPVARGSDRRSTCRPTRRRPSLAAVVIIYFWWRNTQGIRESSNDALRIMQITTVMVVVLLVWAVGTLLCAGRPAAAAADARAHPVLERRARLAARHDAGRRSRPSRSSSASATRSWR